MGWLMGPRGRFVGAADNSSGYTWRPCSGGWNRPEGNAVVVGRQLDNDTNLTLGALTSPVDSDTWSALQIVSTAGSQAGYPSVAVDGSGFATLVWANVTSGSVLMATAQLPADAWTAPP